MYGDCILYHTEGNKGSWKLRASRRAGRGVGGCRNYEMKQSVLVIIELKVVSTLQAEIESLEVDSEG